MKDRHKLILRLKGLSRDLKAAGRLTEKIYGRSSNAPELKGAGKMVDSWVLEITKEIKSIKHHSA